MSTKHFIAGGGLAVLLAATLLLAGCGGSTAATPPGYTCAVSGSYCVTYLRFNDTDYTGSPGINGGYTYVQNTPMSCTAACATAPTQGYVARVLMLLSDDSNSWVESGIWNSGYFGGGTKLFYGVGIGGLPTYHAVAPAASYTSSTYGVGVEIQRYYAGGSNSGFAFRDVPWYGGPQTPIVPPAVSVAMPNADGLSAPNAALTHVEFGEFLHGTSGATADDGNIDPPIVTSSLSGSTALSPVIGGYPNNLYPYALHTVGSGFGFQFYHSSETLDGSAPPIASGSPPFAAWLYFVSADPAHFQWSATSSTDPASNLIFFTCCGGSFQ